MQQNLFFQYCQKLVILSAERKSVLLAKRKGEADYDGVFSFIGGKMETTDESFIAGMKREKTEEIGPKAVVQVMPNVTYNALYRKKDGSSMVLPHVAGVYVSGEIEINEEYSEYKWVPLAELEAFEPKIDTVLPMARWAEKKLTSADEELVEI